MSTARTINSKRYHFAKACTNTICGSAQVVPFIFRSNRLNHQAAIRCQHCSTISIVQRLKIWRHPFWKTQVSRSCTLTWRQFVQDINPITSNEKSLPSWKEKLICIRSFFIVITNKIWTLIFHLAVFKIIKTIICDYKFLITFEWNLHSLKSLE